MTTSNNLKTGDLVLCKVGSFPPWPAVVFPQRLLRKDVIKKKRNNCIAVCFLNDPTYYWEQPHKLKRLEKNIITEYLSKEHKSQSQADLVEAYSQADQFGDLRSFVVERFSSEDRIEDLEKDEELYGKLKSGEDPHITDPDTNSRKRKSSSKDDGKVSSSKKIKASKDITSMAKSSDNRLIIDNSVDKEKKKSNKLDRSRREEISLLLRRRIQRNLIQRDTPPTDVELQESHKLLSKIKENLDDQPPFFDLDTLRKSKLHKLLKVIVNNSDLKEFHDICKSILLHWSDIIATLKAEKLNHLKQAYQSETTDRDDPSLKEVQ
ncbi:uncharacterized protein HLK63_H00121 [Nakaseomyces glabratus]|nr:hypothetical protein LTX96_0003336 [Nakaseomyces glabratus]UCS20778.1 uncharacterized protein GW608_H00121 [Nakaseomyces glabratus]UCS26009.1 uncharacterized protein HLK63_H00121 [Nakaseomyces glabratus]UCS31239.1 uncharacterized protein HLK64_H00121 [Nakaseomyces glabratus]UCS36468.1 uncharacterized protein HLK62_H00121 [Nakaseomyces glabratus]